MHLALATKEGEGGVMVAWWWRRWSGVVRVRVRGSVKGRGEGEREPVKREGE